MFFCCFCPCCHCCCCCCCCFSVYRGGGIIFLVFTHVTFVLTTVILSAILVPKQLVTNALVVMCGWESRNGPLCSFQPWQQKWNIHKTKYLKEGTVEMATSAWNFTPEMSTNNLISEIFNSSGFLPRREAPGISFSVRNVGFWNIRSTRHSKRGGTRRDSLAFLTSFSCNSIQDSRDVRHYESRV